MDLATEIGVWREGANYLMYRSSVILKEKWGFVVFELVVKGFWTSHSFCLRSL